MRQGFRDLFCRGESVRKSRTGAGFVRFTREGLSGFKAFGGLTRFFGR